MQFGDSYQKLWMLRKGLTEYLSGEDTFEDELRRFCSNISLTAFNISPRYRDYLAKVAEDKPPIKEALVSISRIAEKPLDLRQPGILGSLEGLFQYIIGDAEGTQKRINEVGETSTQYLYQSNQKMERFLHGETTERELSFKEECKLHNQNIGAIFGHADSKLEEYKERIADLEGKLELSRRTWITCLQLPGKVKKVKEPEVPAQKNLLERLFHAQYELEESQRDPILDVFRREVNIPGRPIDAVKYLSSTDNLRSTLEKFSDEEVESAREWFGIDVHVTRDGICEILLTPYYPQNLNWNHMMEITGDRGDTPQAGSELVQIFRPQNQLHLILNDNSKENILLANVLGRKMTEGSDRYAHLSDPDNLSSALYGLHKDVKSALAKVCGIKENRPTIPKICEGLLRPFWTPQDDVRSHPLYQMSEEEQKEEYGQILRKIPEEKKEKKVFVPQNLLGKVLVEQSALIKQGEPKHPALDILNRKERKKSLKEMLEYLSSHDALSSVLEGVSDEDLPKVRDMFGCRDENLTPRGICEVLLTPYSLQYLDWDRLSKIKPSSVGPVGEDYMRVFRPNNLLHLLIMEGDQGGNDLAEALIDDDEERSVEEAYSHLSSTAVLMGFLDGLDKDEYKALTQAADQNELISRKDLCGLLLRPFWTAEDDTMGHPLYRMTENEQKEKYGQVLLNVPQEEVEEEPVQEEPAEEEPLEGGISPRDKLEQVILVQFQASCSGSKPFALEWLTGEDVRHNVSYPKAIYDQFSKPETLKARLEDMQANEKGNYRALSRFVTDDVKPDCTPEELCNILLGDPQGSPDKEVIVMNEFEKKYWEAALNGSAVFRQFVRDYNLGNFTVSEALQQITDMGSNIGIFGDSDEDDGWRKMVYKEELFGLPRGLSGEKTWKKLVGSYVDAVDMEIPHSVAQYRVSAESENDNQVVQRMAEELQSKYAKKKKGSWWRRGTALAVAMVFGITAASDSARGWAVDNYEQFISSEKERIEKQEYSASVHSPKDGGIVDLPAGIGKKGSDEKGKERKSAKDKPKGKKEAVAKPAKDQPKEKEQPAAKKQYPISDNLYKNDHRPPKITSFGYIAGKKDYLLADPRSEEELIVLEADDGSAGIIRQIEIVSKIGEDEVKRFMVDGGESIINHWISPSQVCPSEGRCEVDLEAIATDGNGNLKKENVEVKIYPLVIAEFGCGGKEVVSMFRGGISEKRKCGILVKSVNQLSELKVVSHFKKKVKIPGKRKYENKGFDKEFKLDAGEISQYISREGQAYILSYAFSPKQACGEVRCRSKLEVSVGDISGNEETDMTKLTFEPYKYHITKTKYHVEESGKFVFEFEAKYNRKIQNELKGFRFDYLTKPKIPDMNWELDRSIPGSRITGTCPEDKSEVRLTIKASTPLASGKRVSGRKNFKVCSELK